MLIDFGAKSVDQRRLYFVLVQSALRASYRRFVSWFRASTKSTRPWNATSGLL
jgi:hypothetical protein